LLTAPQTARERRGARRVRFRMPGITLQQLPGGALLVKLEEELWPYPKILTDPAARLAVR